MAQLKRSLRWLLMSIIPAMVCIVVADPGQGAPTKWLGSGTPLQSATASLSGTVSDPENTLLPGVDITITSVETSLRRATTTDKAGYFVMALPPGRYVVTAQRTGFATTRMNNVVLSVNGQRAVRIQLKVGEISESVTTEGASLIQTESAAVGTVVDRQFLEKLPLNGRSFGSLIDLTPGVVLTSTAEEAGQFSVNGQRANANYFTVDGVSANAGAWGSQALAGTLPAFNVFGGLNSLVSVDAMQEFSVQTSTYSAEFGRMPGAQVSVITRSGTSQFHGNVFEYFRNDALDANDWFANSRSRPKAALRNNDFGGVFGGPIDRNSTFFFFSYEGLRLRQPKVWITQTPTVAVRQAAPPQLRPFLDAFPIPNGSDLGNGFAESFGSFSNPSTLNATSLRVDHTVNKKLSLFGRFNYAPSTGTQRGDMLNQLYSSQLDATTLTVGSTQAISSRTSNDLRVNYSRSTSVGASWLDGFGGAVPPPDSVLFPSSTNHQQSLFFFLVGPVAYWVGPDDVPTSQRQLNIVDNFQTTTGRHQLKFGIDYRRLSPTVAFLGDDGLGIWVFYNDTNHLISNTGPYVEVEAVPTRSPLLTNFSAYAQDTWKVMPRLTLAYGLRWEVNTPPTDRHGKHAFTVLGLDDPATMTLAPHRTPQWKTTYDNFAPRIGAAYQISRAKWGETVLRGGFGIFYDVGTGPAINGIQGYTVPYYRLQTFQNFPIDFNEISIPPVNLNPGPPYNSLWVFDPNLKLPRTYQWNVSTEHSLGSNQSLTVSYVGAAGRRLLRQEVLRGIGLANPSFTRVVVYRNKATSDYHALQVQFQRRLSRGLQALASYTWSHSIDMASADSAFNLPATKIDPSSDRGSSSFDVRHSFSATTTYDLPGIAENHLAGSLLRNWSVDAIFRARTATPVDLRASQVLFNVPIAGSRPDLVPGEPFYIQDPTVAGGTRLNPAAFKEPPVGRQGTLGRNVVRGFPMSQLDLAMSRAFRFNERFILKFRAELFNVFNHPNFGAPRRQLNDPLFGRATQMLGRDLGGGATVSSLYQIGGPRAIQLSLKLSF